VCVSGGEGQKGRQRSEVYGEGGGSQGRQPAIRLDHWIVLRPEALLHDLKQMGECHVDAHHKEVLEYQSSMVGQIHVPPLVNVKCLQFSN
jgi:hypothetical protein